jgi:RNA polymerase sigma-54 factor
MEKYGLSEQSLKSVREIIRTLDPKPGRVFSSTESLYIAPEVRVVRAPDGSYIAEVESDLLPKVRISKAYRLMANDGNIGKDEKRYLKAQIRAAKALMDGLSMRSFTLKAIAQAIVDLQPDFWSKGFAALRPMTMADVAIRAGVHKTTVSRTVAGKYLRAPRGIFPMRSFFTASLEQEGVGQISNRAVLNRIAAIIKSEDRKNPLSDDAIAAILKNEGIDCARRTVMKYRTKLQIPSSRERKRTS